MSLNKNLRKVLINSETLRKFGYEKKNNLFYLREFNNNLLGIDIQFHRDKYALNIGIHPTNLKAIWCYADWVQDELEDCATMALHGRLHSITKGIDSWFDNVNQLEEHLKEANEYLEVSSKSYKEILEGLKPEDFVGRNYEEIERISSKLFRMCSNTLDAIYLKLYFWPDRYTLYEEMIKNKIEEKPEKVRPVFEQAFKELVN